MRVYLGNIKFGSKKKVSKDIIWRSEGGILRKNEKKADGND